MAETMNAEKDKKAWIDVDAYLGLNEGMNTLAGVAALLLGMATGNPNLAQLGHLLLAVSYGYAFNAEIKAAGGK